MLVSGQPILSTFSVFIQELDHVSLEVLKVKVGCSSVENCSFSLESVIKRPLSA